jgi:histidinol-phosphate aminotransferase
VFICSPNNPTGNTISKEDLVKIARENVVVAVDEAYVEFAGESAVNLIGNYGNLFIIRTFSKAFGLAGLRIGYAITSPELAGLMRRIMPPFPVSVVALKAAEWVLDNSDYVMEVVKVVEEGRRYLFSKLSEIESIKVYPSKANFLLINLGGTGFTSTQVVKVLAEKGVFIRDCSGFRGLGKDYVRVTVGRMEENEAFLKEFKEVINA